MKTPEVERLERQVDALTTALLNTQEQLDRSRELVAYLLEEREKKNETGGGHDE